MNIVEDTNKSIYFANINPELNKVEIDYNETETKLIGLLHDPDSIDYKKCYRKLKGLKIDLDQISGG